MDVWIVRYEGNAGHDTIGVASTSEIGRRLAEEDDPRAPSWSWYEMTDGVYVERERGYFVRRYRVVEA